MDHAHLFFLHSFLTFYFCSFFAYRYVINELIWHSSCKHISSSIFCIISSRAPPFTTCFAVSSQLPPSRHYHKFLFHRFPTPRFPHPPEDPQLCVIFTWFLLYIQLLSFFYILSSDGSSFSFSSSFSPYFSTPSFFILSLSYPLPFHYPVAPPPLAFASSFPLLLAIPCPLFFLLNLLLIRFPIPLRFLVQYG